MLKMGVLACLLDGKGEVISCVVWLLGSVDLGNYVGVCVYRGRRGGEETDKYTVTNAITKHGYASNYARVI